MKIQGPHRTSMQSLGRHNVNITASAGAVKGIALATEGLSSAARALSAEADHLSDVRTERESQQADLMMQKEDNAFWKAWGGKDFFDVSELPDEIVTEGMHLKGRIASAEVLPTMYENFIGERLPEASKIIERDTARQDWFTTRKQVSFGRLQNIQTAANSTIENQIFQDQQINFQNAIDADRPDVALEIANGMKGDPKLTEQYRDNARKRAETIRYDEILINPDMETIQKYIDYLSKDSESYQKANGQLNTNERLIWKRKLESEMNRFNVETEAVNKADMDLLKREYRITRENALKGKEVNLDDYIHLRDRLIFANEDGTLSSEIADLDSAVTEAYEVNIMNKGSKDQRDSFLASYSQRTDVASYERDERLLSLQSANDNLTSAENSDMMQSAVDTGFIKELSPLYIDSNDPANLAAQIGQRVKQHDVAAANYGVSQGYLTKNEVNKLSAVYNTKSPKDQLAFLGATHHELGKDSINLYSQMQVEGAGSLAIAGNVMLNGNASQAETLLVGNEFKRNSGESVKDLRTLINLKLDKDIGTAYWANSQYNANVKEAILDSYIGQVITGGGSTEDLQKLDSGYLWQEGLYQKAVNVVTGGMVTQGKANVPAPVYGMQQEEFDNWIDTISPKAISEMGSLRGGSENFLKRLRAGDYHLQEAGSQGEYTIMNKTGQAMADTNGHLFIFKYDSNYDRIAKKSKRRGQGGRR